MSGLRMFENLVTQLFDDGPFLPDQKGLRWACGSLVGDERKAHNRGMLLKISTRTRGDLMILLFAPYNYVGVYYSWEREDGIKHPFSVENHSWYLESYHDSCWRDGFHRTLWTLEREDQLRGLDIFHGFEVVECSERFVSILRSMTSGNWASKRESQDHIFGRKFHEEPQVYDDDDEE